MSWQLSTATTEVLDDGRRRRYCRIIFVGCHLQPPPHRPMWSTFESAVSGHGSFPTSQTTSWSSVRATSRPRNRRPNRTALRPQAGRRSDRAPHVQIITLPRRYACQKSMRREMRSARPFTVTRATSTLGMGRRIMAERRRTRTGRGRRYWGRAQARNMGRADDSADASLRAFVRALARQAARECFELELKRRAPKIQ